MQMEKIAQLRKEGKIEAAIESCLLKGFGCESSELEKKLYAWCLRDRIKIDISKNNQPRILGDMATIIELKITGHNEYLSKALTWDMAKIVEIIDEDNLGKYLTMLKLISLERPSEAYSFLLMKLHNRLKSHFLYCKTIEWWGFKHFQERDFEPFKGSDGKSYMSLAEKVIYAYYKRKLEELQKQGFEKNTYQRMLHYLEDIAAKKLNCKFLEYYMVKCLIAMGEREEAGKRFQKFALRNQEEFWVYQTYAQVFEEGSDEQLGLLCKGLVCRGKSAMKLGLYEKLLQVLNQRSEKELSKYVLYKIISIRKENGWPVGEQYIAYQSKPSDDGWDEFCEKWALVGEKVLYLGNKKQIILIQYVNAEKGKVSYVLDEQSWGYFNQPKELELKKGDLVSCYLETINSKGLVRASQIEKSTDILECKALKVLTGKLECVAGEYRVGEILIARYLVRDYKAEEALRIILQLEYNREMNKQEWKIKKLEKGEK